MKTVIILAMHGMSPKDFPRNEVVELNNLHNKLELESGAERESLEKRRRELDLKVRQWPRNAINDPYHAASQSLGRHLARASENDVIVGFNEYCAPSLDECFDMAVSKGAEQVIVVTPMMTRGGSHSETDIPEVIRAAKKKHPKLTVLYAWPFDDSQIAEFLASQIQKFAVSLK